MRTSVDELAHLKCRVAERVMQTCRALISIFVIETGGRVVSIPCELNEKTHWYYSILSIILIDCNCGGAVI